MRRWLIFGIACLGLSADVASAQEIRCTQVFMNDSERAICGNETLSALDRQMGALARRVELHQDSYKGDQRRFRKELKKCKGEVGCLSSTYQSRIVELQSIVDQLPPPSAVEAGKLEAKARKADEKWDDQTAARERWAENASESASQSEPEQEVAPPSYSAPPMEVEQPPDAGQPNQAPAVAALQPVPLATSRPDAGLSWGWLTFWILFGLAVLWGIKLKLEEVFYRCPRCRRWGAGVVKNASSENFTSVETRTERTTHKSSSYKVTGYSEKQVHIPVLKTRTTEYIQCRDCGCEWNQTSVR